MFSESTLSPGLVQAYRETQYRTAEPGAMTLTVGQFNPALDLLQRERGATCSAFITACNPYSAELTPSENLQRQADLAAELSRRSLHFVEGIGQHPSNNWPGEPSFLVLGLDLEAAKALCTQWEQNAFVWSGADAVPQLILLR